MAQAGHSIGGHHFLWVIQGQRHAADKRRTSQASKEQNSDCDSSAQVMAVLTQGAMNGY